MQTPLDPEEFAPPKGSSKNPFEKIKDLLSGIPARFKKPSGDKKEIGIEKPVSRGSAFAAVSKLLVPVFAIGKKLFWAVDRLVEGLLKKLPSGIGAKVQPYRTKVLAVLFIFIALLGVKNTLFSGKEKGKNFSRRSHEAERAETRGRDHSRERF